MAKTYKPNVYATSIVAATAVCTIALSYFNPACFTLMPRIATTGLAVFVCGFYLKEAVINGEISKYYYDGGRKKENLNYNEMCYAVLSCSSPMLLNTIVFGTAAYFGLTASVAGYIGFSALAALLSYGAFDILTRKSQNENKPVIEDSNDLLNLVVGSVILTCVHTSVSLGCSFLLGYGLGGLVSKYVSEYVGGGITAFFTSLGTQEVVSSCVTTIFLKDYMDRQSAKTSSVNAERTAVV